MVNKQTLLTVLIFISLTINVNAGKKKGHKEKNPPKPVSYAPIGNVIAISQWKLKKRSLTVKTLLKEK